MSLNKKRGNVGGTLINGGAENGGGDASKIVSQCVRPTAKESKRDMIELLKEIGGGESV